VEALEERQALSTLPPMPVTPGAAQVGPFHTGPELRGHRHGPGAAAVRVVVNGVPLSRAGLQILHQLGLSPLPGSYWYDRRSGAAGLLGQGTGGFLPPGLPLGGRLRANASHGTSGVFVNGRELTAGEDAFLQGMLGVPVVPGRYFLDAGGNAGPEGGPAVVNLVQLAQQRGVGHTGPLSQFDLTGISVLADGGFVGILNDNGESVTFA
jgi:hypothetical protein